MRSEEISQQICIRRAPGGSSTQEANLPATAPERKEPPTTTRQVPSGTVTRTGRSPRKTTDQPWTPTRRSDPHARPFWRLTGASPGPPRWAGPNSDVIEDGERTDDVRWGYPGPPTFQAGRGVQVAHLRSSTRMVPAVASLGSHGAGLPSPRLPSPRRSLTRRNGCRNDLETPSVQYEHRGLFVRFGPGRLRRGPGE